MFLEGRPKKVAVISRGFDMVKIYEIFWLNKPAEVYKTQAGVCKCPSECGIFFAEFAGW